MQHFPKCLLLYIYRAEDAPEVSCFGPLVPCMPSKSKASSAQAAQPSQSWQTDTDADGALPKMQLSAADTPPLWNCSSCSSQRGLSRHSDSTNKQAAKRVEKGYKYPRTPVITEFYKYIGLVIYMGMIRMEHIKDYWRQKHWLHCAIPSYSDAQGQIQKDFLECSHEWSRDGCWKWQEKWYISTWLHLQSKTFAGHNSECLQSLL